MHILFVHQNYPAQFGHIARYLIKNFGYQCTFVSRQPPHGDDGVRRIQYQTRWGATGQNHYLTRTFENTVGQAHSVYEACLPHRDLKPDLIVGHSGFGSTLFLRELYQCPLINYFEYYYRPHNSDLDFRVERQVQELDRLRSYCRNAMIALDLNNCDAGYCPTHYQKNTFPRVYGNKLRVIFDGVDTSVWRRYEGVPRQVGTQPIDANTRIVTYVSRGFEAMRGFDIFMKVAKRIYTALPNVVFVVVGSDRIAYGGDRRFMKEKSFREHVLKQDDYDLSKFLFTGLVPPRQLARLLSLSDLHIYLTVPFVLSWSLFDSLACGCTVLGSATDPVKELITHEKTGLLADFYDVDGLAEQALRVLRDPQAHRALGQAGTALIQEKYTLAKCLPQMLALYQSVLGKPLGRTNGAGPASADGASPAAAAAPTKRATEPPAPPRRPAPGPGGDQPRAAGPNLALPQPAAPGLTVSNIEELLGVLRDSLYASQREWAAANLATVDGRAHPEVVEALRTAARTDGAPTVRATCVRCLIRLKANTPAVMALLKDLQADPDPRVRREASRALGILANGSAAAARTARQPVGAEK
jgi:glycosyltransferase involved in cell wall biosynthesis